jgi:hypothetical protein
MTREGCVRSDAGRGAVAAILLLTAIALCVGCSSKAPRPAVSSPPPATAPDTGLVPSLVRVATLRVGLPSPRRSNLLFTCDESIAVPRIGSASYVHDMLDATGRRWLRVDGPAATQVASATGDSAGALAPDTLIVRAFEDATDEEIAFERGELDAAVFWPGELSARMRSDARFRDPELGLRRRGVVVCVATAADTLAPLRADLDALDREAFGGDLLPWRELEPDPRPEAPARWSVDANLSGARHLERILARVARPGGTRTLKLFYIDQPVVAADAAAAAWRRPGVTPLFALRCPVLVRPAALADVRAIGARAFAELAPNAAPAFGEFKLPVGFWR